MDPPAEMFPWRWPSLVVPPEGTDDSPLMSPRSLVAPRKASTWDYMPVPPGKPTSATNENATQPLPEYSTTCSITGRRAYSWDDPAHMGVGARGSVSDIAGWRGCSWDDPPHVGVGARGPASDIAGRRATANDRLPWDGFAGPQPAYEGSISAWTSEIAAITSGLTSIVTEKKEARSI